MNQDWEKKIYQCYVDIKKLQKKIAAETLSTPIEEVEQSRIALTNLYLLIGEDNVGADLIQAFLEQFINNDNFYHSPNPVHFYMKLILMLVQLDRLNDAQYHLSVLSNYLTVPAPPTYHADILQNIQKNIDLLHIVLPHDEARYPECTALIEEAADFFNIRFDRLPIDYSISIQEFFAFCYETCYLPEKAIPYYEKANMLAEQIDSTIWRIEILKKISQCYEKLGDFKTALSYFKQYRELRFDLSSVKSRAYSQYLIDLYGINKQKEETDALSKKNKHLAGKANSDALTGIFNRHYMQILFAEADAAHSEAISYAAIMLDIDNFKSYNDHYGHLAGDEVIAAVGKVLHAYSDSHIFPIRYGGEEFVVFIKNPVADEAMTLAEKILEDMRALSIPHNYSAVIPYVTVSAGVSEAECDSSEAMGELCIHADEALYASKKNGKNKVTKYGR